MGRLNNVLEEYERDTYDIIRNSYTNMMREINDALNNVLTMTSFDLENSIKQRMMKLKNSLLQNSDNEVSELQKANRAKPKKEAFERYEEILNEEDFSFDVITSPETYNKQEVVHQNKANNYEKNNKQEIAQQNKTNNKPENGVKK